MRGVTVHVFGDCVCWGVGRVFRSVYVCGVWVRTMHVFIFSP